MKYEGEADDFNRTHPELRDGEIFLTNVYLYGAAVDYNDIGWDTKRFGKCAYTIFGERAVGCIPVFVQKSEWEKGGKNVKN